jgi:hypothetical protein
MLAFEPESLAGKGVLLYSIPSGFLFLNQCGEWFLLLAYFSFSFAQTWAKLGSHQPKWQS